MRLCNNWAPGPANIRRRNNVSKTRHQSILKADVEGDSVVEFDSAGNGILPELLGSIPLSGCGYLMPIQHKTGAPRAGFVLVKRRVY